MGTRGVWSLENVELKKPVDDWVPLPNVWISSDNNIGYWIGGGPSPSSKSIVDKMNYSSNTTARIPGADISVPKNDTTCAGTSTEGFTFYGFNGSSYFTSIEKIAYATDTRTTPGNLPNPARSAACAIGSPTKAYIVNGYHPGGPYNETSTYVYATGSAGTMPGVGSYFSMAGSGNTTHGYVGGGPNPNSLMFKFTYSNDSEAQLPGAPLSTPGGRKKPLSAASSTGSYFTGGNPGPMTTTDKLTFATDACARIPSADALTGIAYMQGTGNSNSAYMLNYNAVTFQNLSYSTDTYSNLPSGANLPVNKGTSFGCVSGRGNNQPDATVSETRWFDDAAVTGNKMYCIGPGTAHDTFNMTTETATSLALPGLPSLNNGCSAQNTTHSYIHAGPGKQTRVRKITWSTDSATTIPGQTSRNAENKSGTGNETKGYFTQGGSSPGPCYSGSDRVTYASDTVERVPGADMVGGRPGKFGAQATGNQETGYFMGGGGEWPGFPNYSDTNKLTYATDTNANCPAQMPTGMSMYSGSSASSSTAAYASNYRNPSMHSKVFKLIFSTDTVDTVGNTTVLRNGPAIGGNSTTMYMGGGSAWPNPNRSDFDKLVYATDTISNLPDTNLQSARYYTTGSAQRGERIPVAEPPTATPTDTTVIGLTPAPDVGYFTGGPHYSSTDKLNFTNDTMAAGAQMATPRYNHVCWGNGTNFLDAGGTIASGADRDSRIEKITLSNDTVGALPGANMPNKKRFFVGATGNDNIGYIAGGQTPSSPGTSSILKVTYASYTTDANPGCHLGANAYTSGAGGHGIGSITAAYICAGMPSGSIGEGWHKIPYATNTATYSVVPSFNNPGAGRADDQSTGNKNKGYVTGYNPGSFSTSKTTEVVFATDTASNSTYSPNLGFALNRGATGNQTTGYFHGGLPSPAGGAGNDSYITKFVYSSDTISQLPASSKMTVPRTHCDAGSGVENSHNLSSNTALI